MVDLPALDEELSSILITLVALLVDVANPPMFALPVLLSVDTLDTALLIPDANLEVSKISSARITPA